MKTIPFRDVLWGSVYKLGMDPARKLLKDQAESVVSYINAWVRRLYTSKDWPEWTLIEQRTPNPSTNIVPYEQTVVGGGDEPDAPAPVVPIERVFKVYLTDPRLPGFANDTPFRLMSNGVHVGFEYKPYVWIKFISRTPRFTHAEWDVAKSYGKGALCYSPALGDCFKSKVNGNVGHDPAATAVQSPLQTELVQDATLDSVGLPATAK